MQLTEGEQRALKEFSKKTPLIQNAGLKKTLEAALLAGYNIGRRDAMNEMKEAASKNLESLLTTLKDHSEEGE